MIPLPPHHGPLISLSTSAAKASSGYRGTSFTGRNQGIAGLRHQALDLDAAPNQAQVVPGTAHCRVQCTVSGWRLSLPSLMTFTPRSCPPCPWSGTQLRTHARHTACRWSCASGFGPVAATTGPGLWPPALQISPLPFSDIEPCSDPLRGRMRLGPSSWISLASPVKLNSSKLPFSMAPFESSKARITTQASTMVGNKKRDF